LNQPLQNFLADLKNTSLAVVLNGHVFPQAGYSEPGRPKSVALN